MKRLGYKHVSWKPSVKKFSYSEMSPSSTPNTVTENVALLDGRPQKRFCCGQFRLYGPDSAFSWVVAFANFIVNFLVVGLGRMSGIFYVDFMYIFDIDRKTASIPFSVQQAARNFFGPVAGILGQKYGIRGVTILGGIIASLSSGLLYFKMDITSISILWGIFYGISAAFTTTLNQVSIDQYFEQNRATAGGFAFSGGCVGAFIFPAVMETLISQYGMKGTFLILGAMLLFVIPAAMILVEPFWEKNDVNDDKIYKQNITQYGSFEAGESTHTAAVVPKKDKEQLKVRESKSPSHRVDFAILRENCDFVLQLLTKEISNDSNTINKYSSQEAEKQELLNELEYIYSLVENPENEDLFTSCILQDSVKLSMKLSEKITVTEKDGNEISEDDMSIKLLLKEERRMHIQRKLQELYERNGTRVVSHFPYEDQLRVCKVLIELRKLYEILTEESNINAVYNKAQYFTSSGTHETEKKSVEPNIKKPSNSFWSHIKTAVKLHGNPLFLLICICRGVFMLTFIPVVTIVVDFAMDQGLYRSSGNYAIAILSFGDFLGRLCLGWVTDRAYLTLPRYMLVVMILLGINTAILPFLYAESALLVAVLCFGILQGSLFVRHPVLVSQYMEKHEQSIGMGFINLLSGVVGFTLPAFIGYFRDQLGSYREMFYINGIICAAVGLLWGLEPFFLKHSSKKRKRSMKTLQQK